MSSAKFQSFSAIRNTQIIQQDEQDRQDIKKIVYSDYPAAQRSCLSC